MERVSFFRRGWILIVLTGLSGLLCGCGKETLFKALDAGDTNITFRNDVNESDSFNILDYLYFYNGGGVAIGDINNDGFQDVYFTSNQGSNKLYLNKGGFHFEDITDGAGVAGKGNWKTGVTMADVNNDGLMDIYLCEVGHYKSLHGRNELFINKGNNRFADSAKEYGLDVEGFNTQAVFFDYDNDGDLDMFLVNHSVHSTESFVDASVRTHKNEVSGDKLFRCDIQPSTGGGQTRHFTEVTEQAGIYSSIIGYGLNVVTGDFNNDNWQDIYVSNDFHENDYYYLNNRNGTFSEINRTAFGHESRFSMGSDAADINNDGWLDLITLDMLPADEKVLKSSASDDALDIYNFKISQGYHHQYSKNCLQLNVDGGKKFSDISLFAGVAATDWSWAPLMADFDNDGIKDLFVTNGILRRPNDLDYIRFVSGDYVSGQLQQGRAGDRIAIDQMPQDKFTNFAFKGTKELRFADQSASWGFSEPHFSNGAAYGDLDNDGDLDLVVNRINEAAGIYQNNANSQSGNHYLNVELMAAGENRYAYGAKVIVKTGAAMQMGYVAATKGFESASSSLVHFGLGGSGEVDTLQVIWPTGMVQVLTHVGADQVIRIKQSPSADRGEPLLPGYRAIASLFREVPDSLLRYRHRESKVDDFNVQPLIPHEVSKEGPRLATADINGDGLDDLFVCGSKEQPGKLFQQTGAGLFASTNEELFLKEAFCAVDALFFDADGDRDMDLYVVSGGNEASGKDSSLLDRLYLNDGRGHFSRKALPPVYENKSIAIAADIDQDGDLDLFVGGRVVGNEYGLTPQSNIMLNDGKGAFSIAADHFAPGLQRIGMVTGAAWSDVDKDGWKDLVIVGEWMPITIFKNERGTLRNITAQLNLQSTTGLWTTVTAADIDRNGYDDLLVGNWGENSKMQASANYPLQLYAGDIDGNGRIEQILCEAKEGAYYTFLGKEEIEKMIPGVIRKRFLDYRSMAGKTVEEIFGNKLSDLTKLSASMLSSVLLKNEKGKFTLVKLPPPVQYSPVLAFAVDDFNNDGNPDILSAGNFYGVSPYEGRYDAGYGNVLISRGAAFQCLSPLESGLVLQGEIRDIRKIRTIQNGVLYCFARNNDGLVFYKKNSSMPKQHGSTAH